MKLYKIGYQGIEGSWSHEATFRFIKKMNLKNVKMVPLINSYQVAKELIEGNIDYGVMAINNSIGGIVKETDDALKKNNFINVSSIDLPIHHCLFKKKNVSIDNINKIISHEQAIKQTKQNIKRMFNDVVIMYFEDTALSAKLLFENYFDDNTAVICSEKAGKKFELDCIAKNIEDDKSITKFLLLKM